MAYPGLPNWGYGLNVNLRDLLELLPFTPAGDESRKRRAALQAETDERIGRESRASDMHSLEKERMTVGSALQRQQANVLQETLRQMPIQLLMQLGESLTGAAMQPGSMAAALQQQVLEQVASKLELSTPQPLVSQEDLQTEPKQSWLQRLFGGGERDMAPTELPPGPAVQDLDSEEKIKAWEERQRRRMPLEREMSKARRERTSILEQMFPTAGARDLPYLGGRAVQQPASPMQQPAPQVQMPPPAPPVTSPSIPDFTHPQWQPVIDGIRRGMLGPSGQFPSQRLGEPQAADLSDPGSLMYLNELEQQIRRLYGVR